MSDEEIENFRIEINKVKEFKEKFYEMCEENVYSPNIIFAGLVSLLTESFVNMNISREKIGYEEVPTIEFLKIIGNSIEKFKEKNKDFVN